MPAVEDENHKNLVRDIYTGLLGKDQDRQSETQQSTPERPSTQIDEKELEHVAQAIWAEKCRQELRQYRDWTAAKSWEQDTMRKYAAAALRAVDELKAGRN